MGGGLSALKAAQRNRDVNGQLREHNSAENKVVKLLLLGSGNSGKTTVLKQMQLLHVKEGMGDRNAYKIVVSDNILRGVSILVEAARNLETVLTKLLPKSVEYCAIIKSHVSSGAVWSTVEGQELSLIQMCEFVWADPAVQEALTHEGEISLLEVPIAYFMGNIERIKATSYVPSKDDILHCRARTTGVYSLEFEFNRQKCRVIDVGGQRNERRKWISQFDNVTAVIFIASLAEFDKLCFEDHLKNRLQDSVDVFENSIASPHFAATNFLLFLNKKDLLKEKLKTIQFSKFHPDYTGPNEYEGVVEYIKALYMTRFARIKKEEDRNTILVSYETMATDTNNVDAVLEMSKKVIFNDSLVKNGLM